MKPQPSYHHPTSLVFDSNSGVEDKAKPIEEQYKEKEKEEVQRREERLAREHVEAQAQC